LTNPQDDADAASRQQGVDIMIRKAVLALAATGALGAAGLAPTSASAWGWHGGGFGHHWGYGPRVGVYVGYGSCIRDRWIPTPYGPVLRRVNVCY
jgi:hypothetical protein